MRYYYTVCPIGSISGREDTLTYSSQADLPRGTIATIPFGNRSKIGVVIDKTQKPNFATKPVGDSLAQLPIHLVDLAIWIADYYAARLPIVLQTIVPTGIQKKRRAAFNASPSTQVELPTMTKDQQQVFGAITKSGGTHVLHGVTGSGKTRVYQELAKQTLSEGKSVLVLVPEIALTSQLLEEFNKIHPYVLVLHSGLTESERHVCWQTLQQSQKPWVVIGPRSTLFTPRSDFGLIVVDECHEPSYQQDSQPKYNALRVAKKLSELLPSRPRLVLGSATPSVVDYYVATHTGTPIHTLKSQVSARDISVETIDLRDPVQSGGSNVLSKPLVAAMSRALAANQQIMLFHNRRGTARSGVCTDCGWTAQCNVCHLPMRLHRDIHVLKCHTCSNEMAPPKACPECKGVNIDYKGFGTKRVEEEVRKRFPEVEVARFDSDSQKDAELHILYDELRDNKIQVIIGTQGIAKGLDLPHLSVVGIIQAECELYVPDFSSEERAFQLITQVIGRAGRRGQESAIYIQTYDPDNRVLGYAKDEDYDQFYAHALQERELEHMPPFTYLLHATTGYASDSSAQKAAEVLKQEIANTYPQVYVRGPMPAFYDRRGNKYYQQLVLTANKRSDLVKIARNLPQKWQFTLDPPNLF